MTIKDMQNLNRDTTHLCHLVTKHDLKEFWKFRDFT